MSDTVNRQSKTDQELVQMIRAGKVSWVRQILATRYERAAVEAGTDPVEAIETAIDRSRTHFERVWLMAHGS